MKQSRTKNSIKNITYSVISYFVFLLLQFVLRSVFISCLSGEYLGLNGLFSNILSFLSLAELGVGSAISYALYRPIAENDIVSIQSLMKLYRKLYRRIGIVILVTGSAITPFLSYLIKDMPRNMPEIYLYYVLYVVNSGISYFYTYKRSLLICSQKEYISSVTTGIARVMLSVLQMAALVIGQSYLAYLLIAIAVTFSENVAVSLVADKMYPYLKEKNVPPVSEKDSSDIRKNIMALMCHKIGYVIVFSTDNIIISKFVGLVAVGLYSNYTMIINAVNSLFSRVVASVTASVGNLVQTEDKGHVETVFYRVLFMNCWLRGLSSIALFCLLQFFIRLWVGERFLLPQATVLIIAVNFYIGGVRSPVNIFKEVTGNFRHDQFKALAESVINIVFSIPLAIRFGIAGVLLGTIASTLLLTFWVEAYVLFKYFFEKGITEYIVKQVIYGFVVCLAGAVCFLICNCIPSENISDFILHIVVCVFVPNCIFAFLFSRTGEYKYFWNLLKRQLGR